MKRKYKKLGLMLGLVVVLVTSAGFKSDFFEVAKQMEIYTTLFKELNLYYIDEINPAELTEKAINHMLEELDPYTRYYDEQGVEEVRIHSSGEYSGIGIEPFYYDKKLVVGEVFEGYSAEKEGLKIGDQILSIDGVSSDEFIGEQVLTLLQGLPGSTVDLEILRQGKRMKFTVVREKIEVNPVPHYQMIDQEIGYIAFDRFNSKASSEVKKAFVALKSEGMKQLILDLRGNPGGLLGEAINVTNFFVPKNEVVVKTEAKLKKWSEVYRTKYEPIDLDIPIVVLIDNRSASAAEIVAGSLQDLDRAVVLGERSFGKGLVQRYRNLTYGTKLKLTISKYYTPSGRNIQELDYTNREGAEVPKFSDKKRNAFQTKNGRTVYDGGGIEPDLGLNRPDLTQTTEALLVSDAIFNYANEYFYANKEIAAAEDFVLDNGTFNAFKSYLKKEEESNFKTSSELKFDRAFKMAQEEQIGKGIEAAYADLQKALREQKIEELDKNQVLIEEKLSDEILRRYYYKKGEYQNHIVHSPYIQEAVKVLKDPNQYKSILSNEQ